MIDFDADTAFVKTDLVYDFDNRPVNLLFWACRRGESWYPIMMMPHWASPRIFDPGRSTREQARREAYEIMMLTAQRYPALEVAFRDDYADERDEHGVCICGAQPGEGHRGIHDGMEGSPA